MLLLTSFLNFRPNVNREKNLKPSLVQVLEQKSQKNCENPHRLDVFYGLSLWQVTGSSCKSASKVIYVFMFSYKVISTCMRSYMNNNESPNKPSIHL